MEYEIIPPKSPEIVVTLSGEEAHFIAALIGSAPPVKGEKYGLSMEDNEVHLLAQDFKRAVASAGITYKSIHEWDY